MQHNTTFAALLKLYRKERGYTQAEAAAALGYSRDTIAAWECGRRFPVNSDIPRLASLLAVEKEIIVRAINEPRLAAYRRKVYEQKSQKAATVQATSNDRIAAHPPQVYTFPGIQMKASQARSSFLEANQIEVAMLDLLHVLPQELQALSSISRHQLIESGIAALITRLAQLDGKRISAVEREELSHALGESIANGWKLFLAAGNTEVLAIGQLQLSLVHQTHALLTPTIRAYLYSGMYDLIGIALHFQKRDEEALQSYHNGYLAAVAIGDPWYIAKNLVSQADTYQALNRYSEALQALEEALGYLGDIDIVHRRTRAHLLGCWADVAMTMENYILAQKKLDESVHHLDRATLTEEFDHTCWLQLAGKNALMMGKYQQAAVYLEEALATNPPRWLVRHAGILTLLAIAYARMHEQVRSLQIARQAIPVIGAVNAPMINKYFLEYIREDIVGRFPRNNEIRAFLTQMRQQLPHLAIFVEI